MSGLRSATRAAAWRICMLALSLGIVLLAPAAAAQDLIRFAERFRDNQHALRSYGWKSRTEIELDGQSQKVQLFEMRYDSDGRLQKTLVSEEDGSSKSGGPVRRRRTGKKQKKLQELQTTLTELIQSYVRPDPDAAARLFADATVWEGSGRVEGVTRVRARNVLRQGDEISLWLDSVTRIPQKYQILTSSEGEPVKVTAEFRALQDGPFYPARITVETELKEKRLLMKTENFDYLRQNG